MRIEIEFKFGRTFAECRRMYDEELGRMVRRAHARLLFVYVAVIV